MTSSERSAWKAVASPSLRRWNSPVFWAGSLSETSSLHSLSMGFILRIAVGSLILPDEPGADVVAAFVIEVAGALRGEEQPDARRTSPLQEILHRAFGRGLALGRQIEVRFIEQKHRLQVRRGVSVAPAFDRHQKLRHPELNVQPVA